MAVDRADHAKVQTPWAAASDAVAPGCRYDLLHGLFQLPIAHFAEGFSAFDGAGCFYLWRDDGKWKAVNHALLMQARERQGRDASPNAGIIGSQSVKTTENGGPRGFDAGKLVKGRKRHILTDTDGLLVTGIVHEAFVQDRDGAVPR